MAALAAAVQAVAGDTVELAYVDYGYTQAEPVPDAVRQGTWLVVVRCEEAKHGFVLLPRRWVIRWFFTWATHPLRLAMDDGRLRGTVTGRHFVAFACLMPEPIAPVPTIPPVLP